MHPVMTIINWNHHLHDGMLIMWHHITQHLRSRHFWTGVGVTLLAIGIVTLLIVLTRSAPLEYYPSSQFGYPFTPY